MILLIDAGNTRSKACQLQAHGLSEPKVLDTQMLSHAQGGRAIISCVASAENRQQLATQLQTHNIQSEWLRSPSEGLGLKNSYAEPEKLGVDRFLALAAGFHNSQQACLVIDAGTAITVDICDAEGQHLGGMIAPGLQPLSQALRPNTDLPWIEAGNIDMQDFGKSTEAALQLGALKSAVGLIEHAHKLASRQLKKMSFFITGGAAEYLLPHLEMPLCHEPNLVFQGIELYARRKRW